MPIMTKREKSLLQIWDKFDDLMVERGYGILTHNDVSLGRGTVAYKDDKFSPLFELKIWGGEIAENFVSIFVTDRNGNTILGGETVAIYSLNDVGDFEKNLSLFAKMFEDVYEKYSVYSKSNRLDFAFNEMKLERKIYVDTKNLNKKISVSTTASLDEQIERCAEINKNQVSNSKNDLDIEKNR